MLPFFILQLLTTTGFIWTVSGLKNKPFPEFVCINFVIQFCSQNLLCGISHTCQKLKRDIVKEQWQDQRSLSIDRNFKVSVIPGPYLSALWQFMKDESYEHLLNSHALSLSEEFLDNLTYQVQIKRWRDLNKNACATHLLLKSDVCFSTRDTALLSRGRVGISDKKKYRNYFSYFSLDPYL